jgi:hypothetical protein
MNKTCSSSRPPQFSPQAWRLNKSTARMRKSRWSSINSCPTCPARACGWCSSSTGPAADRPPSTSFVGVHLCARAGRSDPHQSERRVGAYVSSRRGLDGGAGRSSPSQPECQYHGPGQAAGRLRGRHKRSRDRNSGQVVKSIGGAFHCSRPPEGDMLRKRLGRVLINARTGQMSAFGGEPDTPGWRECSRSAAASSRTCY